MPRIELITQLIEEYADVDGISDADKVIGLETLTDSIRDATAKVVGVFDDCTAVAQLPDVPGVTLRDKLTAEVVDGAECSEYLIVHKLHTDVELYTWQSAVFAGLSIAEQEYEGWVNRGHPVILCGILPSGVPVVLKSHVAS